MYTDLSNFYYIPTAIDEDVAKLIIQKCDQLSLAPSEIGIDDYNNGVDLSIRKSLTGWVPTDSWIAGMMKHFIEVANEGLFKYDITKWSDKIQYTTYEGAGSKYNWHTDIAQSPYDESIMRKLSISLLLNDPDEYEGGEFQLMDCAGEKIKTLKPPIGTAIIFPSTTKHRVRPLKSGKRISLVGWYGGPPFR